MRQSYYNTNLDIFSYSEALQNCKDLMNGEELKTLFFLNAHCFNVAQENKDYMAALKKAHYIFNDGIGIKLGSFFNGLNIKANLNGTDLIPLLIGYAAINGKKVFLLGGKPGIAEIAAQKLLDKYPSLNISGINSGFFNFADNKKIIDKINSSRADLLVVGMGVPRQELWITAIKDQLTNVKLCIAGGAILDFMSGTIRRAPRWMQKSKTEWIFRLLLEPNRMWKRYLVGNIKFFMHIILFFVRIKKVENVRSQLR